MSVPPPDLRHAVGYFARLVALIRPYWGPLTKGVVLSAMLGLLGMVTPLLTKLLIDDVYPAEDVGLMHVVVGAILVLTLASTGLGTIQRLYAQQVNTRLASATTLMFFNHLLHLEACFFDTHQVGEITSRFQDVGKALAAINQVLQTVFVQGIYLILVPPILFLLEWRLALVAILSLPLTFLITAVSGRLLRRFWQRTSEAYADLNALQVEALSHIHTFKTLGLEHRTYSRARDQLQLAMRHQLTAGTLSQGLGATHGGLKALNTALFTGFGWSLILTHRMSLGEFLAFSAYVGYLYNPISQLIQLFSQFQQVAVNLGRMFEYLDSPVEQDPTNAYQAPPPIAHRLRGELRCERLTFSYTPGRPLLKDLDVDFPAGSTTAIVGPSGSGKTSLLRLLAGLGRPCSGIIRIDGRPMSQLPLQELRRQIAVVWQEVSLIRGSLWQNLTLGAEQATAAEVERAVDLCGLGEVIAELPAGYDSAIGEWGASLSSGQRQRVSIARAWLRGSPILLFDEATANIDVESEMKILRNLFGSLEQRTLLFVTHRPASAALADRICVLEAGRLRGCGEHRVLLERCAPYQRLFAAGAAGSEARFERAVG